MYSQYSSCTARRPVRPQSDSACALASPTQNAGLPGSPGHLIASVERGLRSSRGSSVKKRFFSASFCDANARPIVSFQRSCSSSVSSSAWPGASYGIAAASYQRCDASSTCTRSASRRGATSERAQHAVHARRRLSQHPEQQVAAADPAIAEPHRLAQRVLERLLGGRARSPACPRAGGRAWPPRQPPGPRRPAAPRRDPARSPPRSPWRRSPPRRAPAPRRPRRRHRRARAAGAPARPARRRSGGRPLPRARRPRAPRV